MKAARPIQKRAKIKPVSDKQRKLNTQYREAKKSSLKKKYGSVPSDGEKVPCEIQSPKCTGWCESTHHSKGRGKYIADQDTFIHGCLACHNYIEHDAEGIPWAKEKGFVKLRV